jgi:hypothetical protein
MEQDIVDMENDVLHHDVLVPLELRIWRQAGRINRHHLFSVEGEALRLTVFRLDFGRAPFLPRGVILAGLLWRVGPDSRRALFPLEPVDLVTQAPGHP